MRTVLILIALFLFTIPTQAQFLQGQYELQLSGTAGSVSETMSWNGTEGSNEVESSLTFAYIAVTPAYYIFRGVAVEFEAGLRAVEGYRPAQSLLLNLAYTHFFRGTVVAAFVRGGGGLSNGIMNPVHWHPGGAKDSFDVTVLQAGAGLKLRAGNTGFVRVELNYRQQDYDADGQLGAADVSVGTVALLLGVGVLL